MLKNLLTLTLGSILPTIINAQSCITAQGNQLSYGSGNTWVGYVYDNSDFTNYMGYVNEGSATSPNFNQDFGGPYVNYTTNGCAIYTESFTIRYKLTKTFDPGTYTFMISGDDRIRLSIDGGATWLIDLWGYNTYLPGTATLTLNGTYNMVLEYMEGAHQNRVYFNVEQTCTAPASVETYGAGTVWNGYYYSGVNFETYKGSTTQSTGANLAFSQNFGGSAVFFPTSDCALYTDFFSARYKMRHTFPPGSYTFTVGGDDKYRFSLDGGTTWVISRWANNDGNTTRYYTVNLSGTYDMVLEYYEKDGSNTIEFTSSNVILLPLSLETFNGKRTQDGIVLNWKMADLGSLQYFDIERSKDGQNFHAAGRVERSGSERNYSFKDLQSANGVIYYRIKMFEETGKIFYSKVIIIPATENMITKIYPTIVNNNVVYLNNDHQLNNATIMINDLTGRILLKKSLGAILAKQTTSIFLDGPGLHSGVFIIQLLDGPEQIKTERILIQ